LDELPKKHFDLNGVCMGYPCKRCGCWFVSIHDWGIHKRKGQCTPKSNATEKIDVGSIEGLGWKSFRNGSGAWVFSKSAPNLAKMIQLRGKVELNGCTYSLSGEKDMFIVRRNSPGCY